MKRSKFSKNLFYLMFLMLALGFNVKNVFAQEESPSVLYVPLIGLTLVPDPLALPNGTGSVTFHYAVKNFLTEVPLTNVQVTDDKCSPVRFLEGDDNNDSKLDFSETWRYSCIVNLTTTTQSTATATGIANNITATHNAYSTVIVGSSSTPPLVSIINTTKVANPLRIPSDEGSEIVFTYKVNNPGVLPLSDVTVTGDKCTIMSGKLGDTNGNNLLDINEVWIYSCTINLRETTTNTVSVEAFANGLRATSDDTITVNVETTALTSPPLFDIQASPGFVGSNYLKFFIWGISVGILAVLVVLYFLIRYRKLEKLQKHLKYIRTR